MSSTDISPRVLQLKDFPELDQEIPWNCIQRRNIAILTAFQKGCDVIITIGVSLPASFSPARFQYLTRACPDDDNYFVEGQDFVGEHCSPIVEGGSPHTELLSNTKVSCPICLCFCRVIFVTHIAYCSSSGSTYATTWRTSAR